MLTGSSTAGPRVMRGALTGDLERAPRWPAVVGEWPVALGLLLLTVVAAPRSAAAHPHVFVDYGMVVAFAADGSVHAQFTWTYDEMFSSMIIESLGPRTGRGLTATDTRAIERTQFQPLKAGQYFLDIRVDGRPVRVTAVRDFRASLDGDRVSFVFTVPIPLQNAREGTLEIRVDDPTYFVAFEPRADAPARWSAPSSYAVRCTLLPSGGSFEAAAVQCTYKRTGQ